MLNNKDLEVGVTTLSREPIMSDQGIKGERVTFCNSAPCVSDFGVPNLRAKIQPTISSFNSWGSVVIQNEDGQQVTVNKGDTVQVVDEEGVATMSGDIFSIRDKSVWIVGDEARLVTPNNIRVKAPEFTV